MNELNFTELLKGIQEAQEFMEMNTGLEFSEIIDAEYETRGFTAGHILGMRDCLMIVQEMLRRMMSGEEE
jgi:flagellar biosynthesis protein FliR